MENANTMANTDTGDPETRSDDEDSLKLIIEEESESTSGHGNVSEGERGVQMDTSGSIATGDSWGSGDATDKATPGYTDMENRWDEESELDDMDMEQKPSTENEDDGYTTDIGERPQETDDVEMFIGDPNSEEPIYSLTSTPQKVEQPCPHVTPQ